MIFQIVRCIVVDRLKHYFLTYKDAPGSEGKRCEIEREYGREEAYEVIQASNKDYLEKYSDLSNLLGRRRYVIYFYST